MVSIASIRIQNQIGKYHFEQIGNSTESIKMAIFSDKKNLLVRQQAQCPVAEPAWWKQSPLYPVQTSVVLVRPLVAFEQVMALMQATLAVSSSLGSPSTVLEYSDAILPEFLECPIVRIPIFWLPFLVEPLAWPIAPSQTPDSIDCFRYCWQHLCSAQPTMCWFHDLAAFCKRLKTLERTSNLSLRCGNNRI